MTILATFMKVVLFCDRIGVRLFKTLDLACKYCELLGNVQCRFIKISYALTTQKNLFIEEYFIGR